MILLAAPGGPTARFANNPRVTLEDREHFKKAWGLDQPIPVQYCRWLGVCNPDVDDKVFGILPSPAAFIGPKGWPNILPEAISGGTNGVLHADFGVSVDSGEPVGPRIIRAALPTLILASFALVIWIGIAILIGVYAAVRRYSLFDQVATVFAYIVAFLYLVVPLGTSVIFPTSVTSKTAQAYAEFANPVFALGSTLMDTPIRSPIGSRRRSGRSLLR